MHFTVSRKKGRTTIRQKPVVVDLGISTVEIYRPGSNAVMINGGRFPGAMRDETYSSFMGRQVLLSWLACVLLLKNGLLLQYQNSAISIWYLYVFLIEISK